MTYAILCHPGHNRVYFEESKYFITRELSIVSLKISTKLSAIRLEYIAGIQYLLFETESALILDDLKKISQLSFIFVLFQYVNTIFIPVELPPFEFIDQNISKFLKYTGKTNEIFTRLLINLAVNSMKITVNGRLNLLDPVAGKGTTLFEGLVCHYNVYGIEIGEKVVAEVYSFLKKYLEKEKYKHQAKIEKVSGPNKAFTAKRYKFTISQDKDKQKSNDSVEFEIVSGDSSYAGSYYKKNFFHVLVGDLPYGVQHSSVTNEKQSSFTRNPKELLAKCLPSWNDVLVPQGIMALSWNTLVLSRKDMTDLLKSNGFQAIEGDMYKFGHRVDQSIHRDIIVAEKMR